MAFNPAKNIANAQQSNGYAMSRLEATFDAALQAINSGKEVRVLLAGSDLESYLNLPHETQSALLQKYRSIGYGVGWKICVDNPATVGVFNFFFDATQQGDLLQNDR